MQVRLRGRRFFRRELSAPLLLFMLACRRHVRRKPGIQSILLPIGNGIELSRYAPNDAAVRELNEMR